MDHQHTFYANKISSFSTCNGCKKPRLGCHICTNRICTYKLCADCLHSFSRKECHDSKGRTSSIMKYSKKALHGASLAGNVTLLALGDISTLPDIASDIKGIFSN
ncbi:hypothetical protein QL285_036162 [Trifolium repens]|nr:hypothetical protein QL285_036162 [Trifolium repens]